MGGLLGPRGSTTSSVHLATQILTRPLFFGRVKYESGLLVSFFMPLSVHTEFNRVGGFAKSCIWSAKWLFITVWPCEECASTT